MMNNNISCRCSVPGCGRTVLARGMCSPHYYRLLRTGDVQLCKPVKKTRGGYTRKDKRVVECRHGMRKFQHVFIAESALGKSLPQGVVVHHVDGDPSNNANNNLVICQNQEYHGLLHVRTRAYRVSGDASNRACRFCKEFDSTDNLKNSIDGRHYHVECQRERNRKVEATRGKRTRTKRWKI